MSDAATLCPSNLHVSVTSRVATAPRLSERVEQKFFIVPHRQGMAFALLRRTCRADREYPVGQVNSLYFDTPDLDQHRRSDSGEYAKDKVRIRWYGEQHDPHRTLACSALSADLIGAASPERLANEPVRVWLELKSRRGFASTKQRVTDDVPASTLAFTALPRGIVSPLTLARTMARFGLFTYAPLRPVIAISYWRYRFVEPQTGFRISIDSRIRSSVVIPGFGCGERGLELPGAIIEVKGPRFEVPHNLRAIAEIGSSWTRYSKYSSSLDGHETAQGSVSRLWPNGMMDGEPGSLARVTRDTASREPEVLHVAPRFVEEYETE